MLMKTLRLDIFPNTPATNYQLQFFEPNNPVPKTRNLSAHELSEFINNSQQHYEKGTSLETLGKQLFAWLNGQEQYLHGYHQDTLLQIPTRHDLENLAWELLNHNDNYLCNNQNHPFTPLRLVTNNAYDVSPANRPLRLLFMASSPENSKKPLNFEHEEALILDATRASNLELIVEESGSLTGLDEWIRAANNDSNCFDVVHLTGHAGFDGETPVFELEDDFGQKTLATADDIACVFTTYGRYPRLLFLSGCKTAQDGTALPSLCEALVVAGIPAVLGWATSVGDDIASFTAKTLYKYLADGIELGRAVALTRHALYGEEQRIFQNSPNYRPQWHYLRFYCDNTPLTPLALGGYLPYHSLHQVFLDKNAKTEVCPREAFVGRRRKLQHALRVLRAKQGSPHYADGLQLEGVGGLGKSSLALRLCQRLEHHLPQRFVWVGVIDETQLRSVLCEELPECAPEINKILNQQLDLSLRLKQLFKQFAAFQQALFIFDDFEQNFIDAPAYQQIQPAAYAIIRALLTAIHTTGFASRVLMTTRGALTMPAPLSLSTIHLDAFRDTDLDKKTTALRLTYLGLIKTDSVSEQEQRAIGLGVGNPRLLESLYRVLADKKLPHEEILTTLTQTQAKFRETLLLQKLLNYQTDVTCKLCATLALFECFMPKAVLTAVFDNNATLEHSLQAALAVGLIEEYQERYLVSRLVIPLVDALNAEQQKTSYSLAAKCLDAQWWQSDYAINDQEIRELIRIAKLGEENAIFSKVAGGLARQLDEQCAYNEAQELYAECLPIRQILGDRKGEGLVLNNLALIHKLHGEYDTALTYYQQSLTINHELGDKKGEGVTLNNLATTAHAKGDNDTALSYLTDSLKIRQEIGDKKGEGATLNNISSIYQVKGDYDTALSYLTDSLKIQQAIGDKQGEGVTLNNISQIYDAKGDNDTALSYLTDSLKIRQEIGDKQGEGVTLYNMGGMQWQAGKQEQAIATWLQSYQIAKQIGATQDLIDMENLAKQLGGEGLEFWEALSQ